MLPSVPHPTLSLAKTMMLTIYLQAKWQCALEEMEVEEKVISKEEPLPYGGAEEHPGLEQTGLEQMAFWNWTRISEAKKEREEGGCGGLGSGWVAIVL